MASNKQKQRAEYCVLVLDMLPAEQLTAALNRMAQDGYLLQQSNQMMIQEVQNVASQWGGPTTQTTTNKLVLHCLFMRPVTVALPGDEWMEGSEE